MVDSLNIGAGVDPAVTQGLTDHEAAMVAKADAGLSTAKSMDSRTGEKTEVTPEVAPEVTPEVEGKTERPEDIPEKFWDAEKGEVNVPALLKAQQDAEKSLLAKNPEVAPKADPENSESPEVSEEAQASAVDAATAEYSESGELTESTYEALAANGISKDMVSTYIAGQQAAVVELQSAAFESFEGTQENYQTAVTWAAANLTEGEIASLDMQLTSTNPAIVREGAKQLATKYSADADITPSKTISGESAAKDNGSYFKSTHEMMSAMKDPRYGKDASYRADVASKIERAGSHGVALYS